MEYLALYRKYRPKTLDEVAGQAEVKKILSTSIINGTITHAYLFSGPRGTGKTTMAKLLAKMVNCSNPVNGGPCEKCDSCLNLLNSNDVIEIDAASNNGVDEIRELREKANLVPSMSKYKVYIIDEVHMLTTQAFNALLKTLEEPPKHVIFILATTEYHKIPLTITSRCQKFQFNKIGIEDIVLTLKNIASKEKIKIEESALYEIAKIADGGMRDSINLLDQLRSVNNDNITLDDVFDVCGNISLDDIVNLLVNLHQQETLPVVSFFEDMNSNGKNYNKFFEDMLMCLRDVILYKRGVTEKFIKIEYDSLTKISDIYSLEEIFKVVDTINYLMEQIRYVSRQSVLVMTSFLQLMSKFEKEKYVINNDEFSDSKMKINFTSSVREKNEEVVKKVLTEDKNKNVENLENDIKNKDILINNAFSVADKKIKLDLQSKFKLIGDYLTDNRYLQAASLLVDTQIEVAGVGYIILTCEYEALVKSIYYNYKACEDLINLLFDDEYNFVVITNEEWEKYKQEYIENLRLGKKYTLMLLDDRIIDVKMLDNEPTAVDKLLDIVGEENIEFK